MEYLQSSPGKKKKKISILKESWYVQEIYYSFLLFYVLLVFIIQAMVLVFSEFVMQNCMLREY